jgi:FMN phosphatase YigB (HAD superfamily)
MGVGPSQVIHVGDNWQFDFIAPKEAGIKAFYLDRKRQNNHQNSVASLLQLEACLAD